MISGALRKKLPKRVPLKTFVWDKMQPAEPDPIFSLLGKFVADKDPRKINVTVGAYRCEQGLPHILPSVKMATEILTKQPLNFEYLPMRGDLEFVDLAVRSALGEKSAYILENRLATSQSVSGTGAFTMAIKFIDRFWKGNKTIHFTNEMWPIHTFIVNESPIDHTSFPYFDSSTCKLDFDGMVKAIDTAPSNSIFVLHVSAHNPSGVDPTFEQWAQIRDIFVKKGHLAIMDLAYQGFGSGDVDLDTEPLRLWEEKNLPFILTQSFSKTMGLYSTRTGVIGITTNNASETEVYNSWLSYISRNSWGNPTKIGSDIAKTILSSEDLTKIWKQDVHNMSNRLKTVKSKIVSGLKNKGRIIS